MRELMLTAEGAHLLALARRSVDGARCAAAAAPTPAHAGIAGRVGRVRDDQAPRRAARLPRHAAMRAGLADEVARCAADSASDDPRFPPVAAGELPDLSVEVSVLGPLEANRSARSRTRSRSAHGLVVEQGARRGLLLPQVATEWGWTPSSSCARPASRPACRRRLAPAARDVYRFEAEVFGD